MGARGRPRILATVWNDFGMRLERKNQSSTTHSCLPYARPFWSISHFPGKIRVSKISTMQCGCLRRKKAKRFTDLPQWHRQNRRASRDCGANKKRDADLQDGETVVFDRNVSLFHKLLRDSSGRPNSRSSRA